MSLIRNIKIIRRRRGNVLAQWTEDDYLRRGWLREREVGWIPTTIDVLTAAPYGDPFEDVLSDVHISREALADALRRKGIWTAEDAEGNLSAIVRAIAIAAKLPANKVQSELGKLQG